MPTPASTGPARRPTGQVALVTGGSAGLGLAIAGCRPRGSIDKLDVATLRACLDVSVVRTWLACRAAVAPMRAAGCGRIVIVTLASALGLVNSGVDDDPWVRQFLAGDVPLRRWAAPEEITRAALLLTDPQSAYITGTVLSADGGWTAH